LHFEHDIRSIEELISRYDSSPGRDIFFIQELSLCTGVFLDKNISKAFLLEESDVMRRERYPSFIREYLSRCSDCQRRIRDARNLWYLWDDFSFV
jgi:hypothetical protein